MLSDERIAQIAGEQAKQRGSSVRLEMEVFRALCREQHEQSKAEGAREEREKLRKEGQAFPEGDFRITHKGKEVGGWSSSAPLILVKLPIPDERGAAVKRFDWDVEHQTEETEHAQCSLAEWYTWHFKYILDAPDEEIMLATFKNFVAFWHEGLRRDLALEPKEWPTPRQEQPEERER